MNSKCASVDNGEIFLLHDVVFINLCIVEKVTSSVLKMKVSEVIHIRKNKNLMMVNTGMSQ